MCTLYCRHLGPGELPTVQFKVHTCTPASNLGYLVSPRKIFHGCQIVHWDPLSAKQSCSQKYFGMGYVKMNFYYPGIQFRLPCIPQDNFSWVPNRLFGPPEYETNVSWKKLVWAILKCMVSMATHSGFENGVMSIKVLISQLLLILDY